MSRDDVNVGVERVLRQLNELLLQPRRLLLVLLNDLWLGWPHDRRRFLARHRRVLHAWAEAQGLLLALGACLLIGVQPLQQRLIARNVDRRDRQLVWPDVGVDQRRLDCQYVGTIVIRSQVDRSQFLLRDERLQLLSELVTLHHLQDLDVLRLWQDVLD